MGASDPSGATTDYDGNGKLDTWDSSEESGAHAKNPHAKRYHRAMAKARYYEAQLRRAELALQSGGFPAPDLGADEIGRIRTAQQDMFEGYKLWTGNPLQPSDGTPYGRFNLVLTPNPQDPLALGPETVSLAPYVGIPLDVGLFGYDLVAWGRGEATLGTVAISAGEFIPGGIGTAIDGTKLLMDYADCTMHYGFGLGHLPIYAGPRAWWER